MKRALTQTATLVGNDTRSHLVGSSAFGFESVISSSAVTRSPFCKWAMTSLLIEAWARMLRWFWRAVAGSGASSGTLGSGLASGFLAGATFAAGFAATIFFLGATGFAGALVAGGRIVVGRFVVAGATIAGSVFVTTGATGVSP